MMEYTLDQIDGIKIVYLIAQPRTGSSLIRNILNHHPTIIAISEKQYAYYLYPRYHAIKIWTDKIIFSYIEDFYIFSNYNFVFQFGERKDLEQLLFEYQKVLTFDRIIRLTALCFFPDKDKSLVNTIVFKEIFMEEHLPYLSNYFPEGRFIFLYRHPLDTISRMRNLLEVEHKTKKRVESIAIKWNYSYRMIEKNRKKIALKKQLRVSYEDFIINIVNESQRICAFLDVNYDERMLDYTAEVDLSNKINFDGRFGISNSDYVELHKGSFEEVNLKKIGRWKSELSEKEIALSWKVCEKTAKEIGYDEEIDTNTVVFDFYYFFCLLKHHLFFNGIMRLWMIVPYSIRWLYKKYFD